MARAARKENGASQVARCEEPVDFTGVPDIHDIELGDDCLPVGFPADYGIPTLGPVVMGWAETVLASVDNINEPWHFTPAQGRFLLWFYALNPRNDFKFFYQHAQVILPKGSGKSPLAGVISIIEFLGPCVFDGFDIDKQPIGVQRSNSEVQVSATAFSQTRNIMRPVKSMLEGGKLLGFYPQLAVGKLAINCGRNQILPTTVNSTSAEGTTPDFCAYDETGLWTESNGGVALYEAQDRNLGKRGGRSIDVTNCFVPGEGSVAELIYNSHQQFLEGLASDQRILRWHLQAPADTDVENIDSLRHAISVVYGISPWADQKDILQRILKQTTPLEVTYRFYLNQIRTADDSLVAPNDFDACKIEDTLHAGDEIVLGFDGAKSNDSTVLMALRVEDRFFSPIKIWERPKRARKWQINRVEVDETVKWAFETYNVSAFYADVEHFESYVDKWSIEYRDKLKLRATPSASVSFDMRGRQKEIIKTNESLVASIENHQIKHDGDLTMRRHVLNTKRKVSPLGGLSFRKEYGKPMNKIDAWAAMVAADAARTKLLNVTKRRRKTKAAVLL